MTSLTSRHATFAFIAFVLFTSAAAQDTCEYGETTYNNSDVFAKGDGCNNCTCNDGTVDCEKNDCSEPKQTCEHGGQVYDDGANIPAGDDCNTCSCSDGQVSCTEKACMEEQCDMQSLRDCFVKMAESTVYVMSRADKHWMCRSRESVHNCVEKQLRLCPAQFGALMTKFVGHHVQMFASISEMFCDYGELI
ncbi:kielin/chordin-like protein [Mya arenaria]|uniref:kielin/chordin-like protein n=1 Tax=Mya arenaria TaxID=6604 RepID=UPI0022E2F80D|nr:kielin/chordin-like protein [Mya arenaria]